LLSGRAPYELKDSTTGQLVEVVCKQDPAPAGIDGDLDALIARCLRKEMALSWQATGAGINLRFLLTTQTGNPYGFDLHLNAEVGHRSPIPFSTYSPPICLSRSKCVPVTVQVGGLDSVLCRHLYIPDAVRNCSGVLSSTRPGP